MKYFVSINFNTSILFQINGNEIKGSIKSKPEHGKANQELIKLLSNYFQVSSEKIKIVQGIKSRKKVVHISYEFTNETKNIFLTVVQIDILIFANRTRI
jgi:uncharacterized protein (TIGR00251 family)